MNSFITDSFKTYHLLRIPNQIHEGEKLVFKFIFVFHKCFISLYGNNVEIVIVRINGGGEFLISETRIVNM